MTERKLTCIQCPIGCSLTVTIDGDIDETTGLALPGASVTVTGNSCPRGEEYGRKEVTGPTRTVTSIVPVNGGEIPMVSVKTESDIPRQKIADVMDEIRKAAVDAPVKIGDIIIHDAAGTGINIIATKNVGTA